MLLNYHSFAATIILNVIHTCCYAHLLSTLLQQIEEGQQVSLQHQLSALASQARRNEEWPRFIFTATYELLLYIL